jgi:prepilin-type N-terminal cleavage/methylation domain-containing protein
LLVLFLLNKKAPAFGGGFFINQEEFLMASSKGFTLIEMTIVLVILGVMASFAIPNFVVSMEQTKAQTVKNNLLAIAAAEEKYFEDHGNYCIDTGAGTCGNSRATLNTNLKLSISDSFVYNCPAAGQYYTCTAGDGTDTLTLTGVNIVGNTATGNSVSCAGGSGPPNCGIS